MIRPATDDVERRQDAAATPRPQGWRWVIIPLIIWALARVVGYLMLAVAAPHQSALTHDLEIQVHHPTPASPSVTQILANWDGQWYWEIAEDGYPREVPTVDGEAVQNRLAFFPLYPMTVRTVMTITTLDFPYAAVLVSLIASAIATLVIYRLVRDTGGHGLALAVVLAVNTYPAAPILGLAYGEGLNLLLIATALSLLHHRRYPWLLPVVLLLGLSRPITLALAAVMGLHFLRRLRARGSDPFPRRELLTLLLLGGITVAATGLWPLIAGILTGDRSAYAQSIGSWAGEEGAPVGPAASWLAETFREPAYALVLVPLVGCLFLATFTKQGRNLGPDLRAWSWLYPLYMIAVTSPGAGLIRYLLLAIGPLPLILARYPEEGSRSDKVARWSFVAALTLIGLVGQWFWIRYSWVVDIEHYRGLFP